MSIKTRIIGPIGEDLEAHVHKLGGINKAHAGLLVLTEPFVIPNPLFRPFLNDTFGTAMNQNAAFSGTPEIIHNGGTSVEWTGSALQGTWNFADSGKVSLTSADNNDEATFAEETPTTIAMSGFTALTGKINLTIYNDLNNNLNVEFDLAGVVVGNSVNLDDYIDTGLIGTEQKFVIPKADLGLTTQLIDGFSIVLNRIGGTKPTMTFDDIQLEQTGSPAVFTVEIPKGTRYRVSALRFSIADALAGTVTNGTMPGLAYNKILALTALTNGIVFQRTQGGEVNLSVTFKQLSDWLRVGFTIENSISDGTNTMIDLEVKFSDPIILEGDTDDNLTLTISEDLSGLLLLSAAARGANEAKVVL